MTVIQDELASVGRSVSNFPIQVRRDFDGTSPELINAYEEVGVTDIVLSCNTGDVEEIKNIITSFAETSIDS